MDRSTEKVLTAEAWEEAGAIIEDQTPELADRIRAAIAGKDYGEEVALILTPSEEELIICGGVLAALEN